MDLELRLSLSPLRAKDSAPPSQLPSERPPAGWRRARQGPPTTSAPWEEGSSSCRLSSSSPQCGEEEDGMWGPHATPHASARDAGERSGVPHSRGGSPGGPSLWRGCKPGAEDQDQTPSSGSVSELEESVGNSPQMKHTRRMPHQSSPHGVEHRQTTIDQGFTTLDRGPPAVDLGQAFPTLRQDWQGEGTGAGSASPCQPGTRLLPAVAATAGHSPSNMDHSNMSSGLQTLDLIRQPQEQQTQEQQTQGQQRLLLGDTGAPEQLYSPPTGKWHEPCPAHNILRSSPRGAAIAGALWTAGIAPAPGEGLMPAAGIGGVSAGGAGASSGPDVSEGGSGVGAGASSAAGPRGLLEAPSSLISSNLEPMGGGAGSKFALTRPLLPGAAAGETAQGWCRHSLLQTPHTPSEQGALSMIGQRRALQLMDHHPSMAGPACGCPTGSHKQDFNQQLNHELNHKSNHESTNKSNHEFNHKSNHQSNHQSNLEFNHHLDHQLNLKLPPHQAQGGAQALRSSPLAPQGGWRRVDSGLREELAGPSPQAWDQPTVSSLGPDMLQLRDLHPSIANSPKQDFHHQFNLQLVPRDTKGGVQGDCRRAEIRPKEESTGARPDAKGSHANGLGTFQPGMIRKETPRAPTDWGGSVTPPSHTVGVGPTLFPRQLGPSLPIDGGSPLGLPSHPKQGSPPVGDSSQKATEDRCRDMLGRNAGVLKKGSFHRFGNDGHMWNKYSHKRLRNSKTERSYYSCAEKDSLGCPARKLVDRPQREYALGDHSCDVVTLEGNHNHPALRTAYDRTILSTAPLGENHPPHQESQQL